MTELPIRRTTEIVAELLPLAGARVLDIGCGNGALVRFMAKAGARVTGIEARESALARARAETPVGDEDYGLGRGEDLPFADASFDAVVFMNSLHHVPVDAQAPALAEARRVLRGDGRVLVIEPLAEGPNFTVMRPVDDETEVRAHALGVIRGAAAEFGLVEARETVWRNRLRYAGFEEFETSVIDVDESRRARFAEVGAEVRALFDALAQRQDGAYVLDQPMRANLLRVAKS